MIPVISPPATSVPEQDCSGTRLALRGGYPPAEGVATIFRADSLLAEAVAARRLFFQPAVTSCSGWQVIAWGRTRAEGTLVTGRCRDCPLLALLPFAWRLALASMRRY